MRVFAGIALSPELKKSAAAWREAHADLPVRWLRSEDLHVTLAPPWAEENPDGVLRRLAELSAAPFTLEFRAVTYGPDPRSPSLIWAEGEAPAELLRLKNEIDRILEITPEARPLRLHATLARFRPENFRDFTAPGLPETVAWRMTVRSVALFRSNLSPSGAHYEILGEVYLSTRLSPTRRPDAW